MHNVEVDVSIVSLQIVIDARYPISLGVVVVAEFANQTLIIDNSPFVPSDNVEATIVIDEVNTCHGGLSDI